MEYREYLDVIQTEVGGRYDISALFHELSLLNEVTTDLAAPVSSMDVDLVAGIDALGFVLGTGVALELGVGFVPIRKGGKLPISEGRRIQKTLTDYTDTEKTLELDRAAVSPGDRILIVDDWIETAGQMTAAISLVERANGIVDGISVVGVNDEETKETRELAATYSLHSIKPR